MNSVHRVMLSLALTTWVAPGCGPTPRPVPPPPGPSPPGPVAPGPPINPATAPVQLAAAINAERAKAGLPPLRRDPRLERAAAGHSAHMAKVGKLGHMGIGDGDPWTRLTAAGVRWKAASEVVAAGQTSAAQATADWMSDPPHREAIMGKYVLMGGGVATGRGIAGADTAYWTVDLATE